MSMRFGRGLVAATALSFLTVGGLQATAAMAAVPAGFDEGAGVVSVEVVPLSATSDLSGRPVVEQPPVVSPPFIETSGDGDDGVLPPRTYDPRTGGKLPICGTMPIPPYGQGC